MKYTREELCKKYRGERDALYKKRIGYLNKQKRKNISKRAYGKLNTQIKGIGTKIDKYRSKLFKCGKRWQKLVTKRTSLTRKKNLLIKKIRQVPVGTERNKLYLQLTGINNDLRDIYILMGKDIVIKKGKVSSEMDSESGLFQENIPVWKLKEDVLPALDSGDFSLVMVNGEVYDLETNYVTALFAIDEAIDLVFASQARRETKTPMCQVIYDEITKTITITI